MTEEKKIVEGYLNSKQLCDILNISRATLGTLVTKGVPHIRLTTEMRFKLSEVEDWLKKNTKA